MTEEIIHYVQIKLSGKKIDHVVMIKIPDSEIDGIYNSDHVEFNIIRKSINESSIIDRKSEVRIKHD